MFIYRLCTYYYIIIYTHTYICVYTYDIYARLVTGHVYTCSSVSPCLTVRNNTRNPTYLLQGALLGFAAVEPRRDGLAHKLIHVWLCQLREKHQFTFGLRLAVLLARCKLAMPGTRGK